MERPLEPSYLDTPVIANEVTEWEGNGLHAGCATIQGWQHLQEDTHSIKISDPNAGAQQISFFALFDGHGGSAISTSCANTLYGRIQAADGYLKEGVPPIAECMRQGFLDTDEGLKTAHPAGDQSASVGSTAIVALVSPTHLFIGNCGNCRAMLVRGGQCAALSFDHTPSEANEVERIESAGETVTEGRVGGKVVASRAFGDFAFKRRGDLPPERQAVCAAPEIAVVERDEEDAYIVLACAAVWTSIGGTEDAGEFVMGQAKEGKGPAGIAGALVEECLARGSKDNLTAIVVAFPRSSKAA